MSEEETKTEENKGKSPLGIILVLFAILAIILGYGLYNNAQKAKDTTNIQTAAVSEVLSKKSSEDQLEQWDDFLVNSAQYLIRSRSKVIQALTESH